MPALHAKCNCDSDEPFSAPAHHEIKVPCISAYLIDRFAIAVKAARYVEGGADQLVTRLLSDPASIPSDAKSDAWLGY